MDLRRALLLRLPPGGLRAAAQGVVGRRRAGAAAAQPPPSLFAAMERLTAAAFGQRRKMLRGSLRASAARRCSSAPESTGRRPETLTIPEWDRLVMLLGASASGQANAGGDGAANDGVGGRPTSVGGWLDIGCDEHLCRRPVPDGRGRRFDGCRCPSAGRRARGDGGGEARQDHRRTPAEGGQGGRQIKHNVRSSRLSAGGMASGAKSAAVRSLEHRRPRGSASPGTLSPAGLDRHQRRVQQQAGAFAAVVPVVGHGPGPLPHQHGAGDHPIDAAARR